MNPFQVRILESEFITHDTKRFVTEKPKNFSFVPGQAAEISIDIPEWREEKRPFTFTSLPDWPYLEFIIKIYEEHNGVTRQLGKINNDTSLLIHDVFGAIKYKGPGVFIAGGTGITPFISILRAIKATGAPGSNGLIYSNKSAEDIILGNELFNLLGAGFINVFTRQGVIGFLEKHIDRKFLIETIRDFDRHFYVCGPEKFVSDITNILISLGAQPDSLVFDK